MPKPIAIRLGVEGQAEVRRAFDEVARTGQDAFKGIERATESAGTAADRQTARWQRMATVAREAASQASQQERLNTLLGVKPVEEGAARRSASVFQKAFEHEDMVRTAREAQNASTAQMRINTLLGVRETPTGAARDSASVFEQQARAAEEVERRNQALQREMSALAARYDPLIAAGNRYREALAAISQAEQAGALSAGAAATARLQETRAFEAARDKIAQSGAVQKATVERMVAGKTIAVDRGADVAAYGAELERTRARFAPLFAAQQAYRVELKEIAQASKVGAINEDERAAAVRRTKAAFSEQVREIRTANSETGRGRRLRPDEVQNLAYQGSDVISQLGSGTSLTQTLMQQGPQVAQLFVGPGSASFKETLSSAATAVGRFITPLTVAGTALAAFAGAAVYASYSYGERQREIARSTTGYGRLSGATPQDINVAAEASARAGEVSVGTARDVAAVYASAGIKPEFYNDLIKLTRDYANQTRQEIPDAAADLAGSLSNLGTGIDAIEKRVGPLGNGVGEAAKRLAAGGYEVEATRRIIEALPGTLVKASTQMGAFAREWERTTNSLKSGWDWFSGVISGPGNSIADQLARSHARMEQIRASQARYGTPQNAPLYEATVRVEQRRIDDLTGKRDAEKASGVAAIIDQRAGVASRAVASLNPEMEKITALKAERDKIGKSLADFAGTITEGNKGPTIDGGAEKALSTYKALNEQIERLEESYRKGGASAEAAVRAADFQKASASLPEFERGLAEINREYDELIRNAKDAGDLNAEQRGARVLELEGARKSRIAAYQEQNRQRVRAEMSIPDDYLPTIRRVESDGDDKAVSRTGAVGRYQFIKSTWLELFPQVKSELFAELRAANTNAAGDVDQKALKEAILARRTDPKIQDEMAEALARRNGLELARQGFEVSTRNLYGAHNIGAGGITALLRAQREGRGGDSAQSILDRINPDLVAGNRAFYGNGKSVDDALATLQRKVLSNNSVARSTRESVSAVEAETQALGKSAAERERLVAINEQLRAARESGSELGQFRNAQEYEAAAAKGLTGELKLQSEALEANVRLRQAAARTNLSARFEQDSREAYAALGRTSDEQTAYSQARLYATPDTAEFDAAYSRLRDIQSLVETKSTTGGFLKDLKDDLLAGTSLSNSLDRALGRVASRLMDKALDSALSSLFSSVAPNGGSGGAGGIMSIVASMFSGNAPKFASGRIPGYAEGLTTRASVDTAGVIHGPGTGTSDSILAVMNERSPIRISDREAIIRADAVAHYGPSVIKAINERTLSLAMLGERDASADLVGAERYAVGMVPESPRPFVSPAATMSRAATPSAPVVNFSPLIVPPAGYETRLTEGRDERGNRRPEISFVEMTASGIKSPKGRRAIGQAGRLVSG